MRKLILFSIQVLVLFACEQKKNESGIKEAVVPENAPLVAVDNSNRINQDTIQSFDAEVYKLYISKAILSELNQKLPEWELPEPSHWENFWFKQYKKDNALVNYSSSDFNCDNKSDYAVLLQNKNNKQYAVWVLLAKQKEFSIIKLDNLGEAKRPLQYGIELIPEGPLSYINFENDNPQSITLRCPGIQISFFESSAVTYFWKGNKFVSVTTGD